MKLLLKKIKSYFNSKLPVGQKEFDEWANDIIELSGRYADEDSMKFAIATMVLHADSKHGSLPKAYFVTRLRKSAANQVAGQVFHDIKEKQKAAAEAAKQLAEATAALEFVVSDETT